MTPEQHSTLEHPEKNRLFVFFVQLLLSLIVLGCAIALAAYYLKTSQKAQPHKRKSNPPLVKTQSAHYQSHQIRVIAMGTVIAAKKINLKARVKGEIVTTSDEFVPGGFFTKGEELLSIDPTDYKLIVLQLQSDVAKAENNLLLEQGFQRVAQKEFDLLGQGVSETEKRLMLREPQLAIKKSELATARAKLNQAELNLSRTKVTAPFNAVIQSRSTNAGSLVSESTPLAGLVATDTFWLELTVSVDQLQWINIPVTTSQQGSTVTIFLQDAAREKTFRTGHVVRLGAELQKEGRMAIVYVAVSDPLCLLPENKNLPKLLLGSFIHAVINGVQLTAVMPIKRSYLHDNNTLWLVTDKNSLEIRPVKIITGNRDQFFVSSGISEGETLITSGLATPVNGIPLRLIPTAQDQSIHKNRPESKQPITSGEKTR